MTLKHLGDEETEGTTVVESVHLSGQPQAALWDIILKGNTVTSIIPHVNATATAEAAHPLLLPSLCHPHLHLDKAFLLSSNPDRYGDLVPTAGTFKEALENTAKAKARYTTEDLLLRGSQLIAESILYGVTAMRAFVEVDHTVGMKCLDVAMELQKRFAGKCLVQIAAFAQDPLLSGEWGYENIGLMEEALRREEVDVVGTTPYVERGHEVAVKNIQWAVRAALKKRCHLDFHLDYNLNEDTPSTVWDVIRILKENQWSQKSNKTIALGHCTRLTLFSHEEMQRLAQEIHESNLPISFVGLPSSDLYMMGRPDSPYGGTRPRATLQVPTMIKAYGLNAAIGVNNVGNAFTPWGSCDPLALASLGVGLYHAGSKEDVHLLYECVSTRALMAIGLANVQKREGTNCNGVQIACVTCRRRNQAPPCDASHPACEWHIYPVNSAPGKLE